MKYLIEECGANEVGPAFVKESPEKTVNCYVRSSGSEIGGISDGYHTFGELYEHRIALWIALCHMADSYSDEIGYSPNAESRPWRSKLHSDGSSIDGWFVLGIGKAAGKQITYHLPLAKWEECNFVSTLDKAPEFDGHTSADVIARLREIL